MFRFAADAERAAMCACHLKHSWRHRHVLATSKCELEKLGNYQEMQTKERNAEHDPVETARHVVLAWLQCLQYTISAVLYRPQKDRIPSVGPVKP
jgi:hypothetical protein